MTQTEQLHQLVSTAILNGYPIDNSKVRWHPYMHPKGEVSLEILPFSGPGTSTPATELLIDETFLSFLFKGQDVDINDLIDIFTDQVDDDPSLLIPMVYLEVIRHEL